MRLTLLFPAFPRILDTFLPVIPSAEYRMAMDAAVVVGREGECCRFPFPHPIPPAGIWHAFMSGIVEELQAGVAREAEEGKRIQVMSSHKRIWD